MGFKLTIGRKLRVFRYRVSFPARNWDSLESVLPASLFALGISIRAVLLGVISFVVLQLLTATEMYATALVLAAVGAHIAIDLARQAARADRMLHRFVTDVTAQDFQRMPGSQAALRGFSQLARALDDAMASAGSVRAASHREIDRLRTLLDNVTAAVLLVDDHESVVLANRSARKLASRPVCRLHEIPAIGESLATALLAISPGERAVLRLTSGRRVLASVAQFSASDGRVRLISLQTIESELDAAEIKAWQDLARILAHEMMNSLTPISSLATSIRPLLNTLTPCTDAHNARSVVDDVTTAIDAIARRSTGLMSFVERYRRVAELPRPALRPMRVAETLARVERLLAPAFVAKRISLVCHTNPADLSIHADPELLEQALINLLHNAMDAVDGVEQAQIQLDCRIVDDQTSISVTDNGRGFDPALRDRMFIPFFTSKPGGSGIGLSLARQIARAHHGYLEAAASSPRGSVFRLLIPQRPRP
jgi:nitrogen fixation/metabolism regulation signal transduction histidine kinase